MLGEGRVCLLGLDAVRQRLGPRWPGHRDRVYHHAEQTLRRKLGDHVFLVRVSETDFLVAQPGVDRLSGQAYCLNCLREVLTYFLGEALLADIVVHEVSSIQDGKIAARQLDAGLIEARAAEAEATFPRRRLPHPARRRRLTRSIAGRRSSPRTAGACACPAG